MMRVSPLKAGLSSRTESSTNPVTMVDPTGLQYGGPHGPDSTQAGIDAHNAYVRQHSRGCNPGAHITEEQWGHILQALAIIAQHDPTYASRGSRTIDTTQIYNAKNGFGSAVFEALGMHGAQTFPLTGDVFLPIDFIFRQSPEMWTPMLVHTLANEMSHHRDGGSELESSQCEVRVLESWLKTRDMNSTNDVYNSITGYLERQLDNARRDVRKYSK